MENTKKLYKLEGRIQHYAWGGFDFLPNLLQVPNVGHKPFAEYWMGAHTSAPSLVETGEDEKQSLYQLIAENARPMLGSATAEAFGKLPYLFKILDVKDMLSIQVHPSKKDAVLAYEEENAREVALDDPKRNYKDDNHKPELAYALSDFWLLHGFKTPEKLQKILASTPELKFLQSVFQDDGYDGLYRFVMELPQEEVNLRLMPLLERIIPLYEKGSIEKSSEDFWAARAALTFNAPGRVDRGIFSIYIFNLVHLKIGDAIFQDAGIPHAYLEGQNVEIMANSDNVLRGGLTPKHIDVTELLKHVKCEPIVPAVILGIPSGNPAEQVFMTPAADFELRMISLQAGASTTLPVKTTDIFFVYSGQVDVSETGGDGSGPVQSATGVAGPELLEREEGEAFVAERGARLQLRSANGAVVFRATVPNA